MAENNKMQNEGITLGSELKKFRIQADLKQAALARMAEVDTSMISRYENNKSLPEVGTLQNLINALHRRGIPLDDLLGLWNFIEVAPASISESNIRSVLVEFQSLYDDFKNDPETIALLDKKLVSIENLYRDKKDAINEINNMQWGTAIKLLNKAKEAYLLENYERELMLIDEKIAICYFNLGNYAYAKFHFNSARQAAGRLEDKKAQARLLILLGNSNRRQGGKKWGEAIELYQQAQEIYKKLEDIRGQLECTRRIAAVHLYKEEPKDALELLLGALPLCEDEQLWRDRAKFLQHIGWANSILGHWKQGREYCEEALAILNENDASGEDLIKGQLYLGEASRIDRKIELVDVVVKDGHITHAEIHVPRSLDTAERAYRSAESYIIGEDKKAKDNREYVLFSGRIYLALARINLKRDGNGHKGFDQAIEYFNKSLEIQLELGEDYRIAEVLDEQGVLLLRLNRFTEAEGKLIQAAHIYETLETHMHKANVLVSLCELYFSSDSPDKALEKIEEVKALEESSSLVDYQLSIAEFILGEINFSQEQLGEGISAFKRSSEYAFNRNLESFYERMELILTYLTSDACVLSQEVKQSVLKDYETYWQTKVPELIGKYSDHWQKTYANVDPSIDYLIDVTNAWFKHIDDQLNALRHLEDYNNEINHQSARED